MNSSINNNGRAKDISPSNILDLFMFLYEYITKNAASDGRPPVNRPYPSIFFAIINRTKSTMYALDPRKGKIDAIAGDKKDKIILSPFCNKRRVSPPYAFLKKR